MAFWKSSRGREEDNCIPGLSTHHMLPALPPGFASLPSRSGPFLQAQQSVSQNQRGLPAGLDEGRRAHC